MGLFRIGVALSGCILAFLLHFGDNSEIGRLNKQWFFH